MNATKTILFPTDLGENAHNVFDLARSLAQVHGARLFVLHVIPVRPQEGVAAHAQERERARHWEDDWESYKREMEDKLFSLRSPDATVHVEHLLKEGDRRTCILKTAQDVDCDLIIMETHGKPEQECHVLGSLAAEFVRQPPCPVLLVKFPR